MLSEPQEITMKEASKLSKTDVEFIATCRQKYRGKMYDADDLIPLVDKDKPSLVAVKKVKMVLSKKGLEKMENRKSKNPKVKKFSKKKSVKSGKNKSMSGKGKTK